MSFLPRTILSLALASGCAAGDLEPCSSDSESESESTDGPDVERACDDQWRCFVRVDGWTAWAQYPHGLDEILASKDLELAGQVEDATCYYYTAADDIDTQFCEITVDGVALLGRLTAHVDYEIAPCADIAPPWHYTLESPNGDCYGAVGPLAVLLSDSP